jgi:hypothetical protein
MDGMSSQEGKMRCSSRVGVSGMGVSRHIDALLFMGSIGVVGLLVVEEMDQARKAGHMQRWEGLSLPVFLRY